MSSPIKPSIKTEFIPLFLIIISIILSFYFYTNFPDQVPIHWNAAGEVDNYGTRSLGAFLFPAIIVGMYLMFLFIPYLDPKKNRYEQFRKVYHIFKNLLISMMFVMYVLTGLAGMGNDINIVIWMPIMVGVMFVFLGNYMSKIKPNWFMGIRTPWTLSSEEVWNKTHRMGAKIFIIGGIIIALIPFAEVKFRTPLLLFTVFLMVFGTISYSYLAYRAEEKKE